MKIVVGLMYSAGLRVGAITGLKLRNLEKVEQCYKVIVYQGTNEQYTSFCTRECVSFIDAYLQYRTKQGEILGPNSFLIRDQFDVTDIDQIRNKSRGIATGTLKVMLNLTLIKAGVRTVDHKEVRTAQVRIRTSNSSNAILTNYIDYYTSVMAPMASNHGSILNYKNGRMNLVTS